MHNALLIIGFDWSATSHKKSMAQIKMWTLTCPARRGNVFSMLVHVPCMSSALEKTAMSNNLCCELYPLLCPTGYRKFFNATFRSMISEAAFLFRAIPVLF